MNAQTLQVIRDVLASLAALVATTVAVLGYRAWHRQILGKTEHDAARSVLLCGLKVREQMRDIRKALPYLPSAEQLAKQLAAAANKPWFKVFRAKQRKLWETQCEGRLKRLTDRLVELRLAVLEAEALWGANANVPVESLEAMALQLEVGLWDYFWANTFFDDAKDFPEPSVEKWADIGIGQPRPRKGTDAKDPFGKRVDAAVSELENYYRPKLRLKGR